MDHTCPGGRGSAPIGYEPFDVVLPDAVGEVCVSELGGPNALLLLLDPPSGFEGQPDGPVEVLVRYGFQSVRVEELEQAADGLLNGGGVAPGEGVPEVDATVQGGDPALGPQAVPALGEEVAHEAEVPRE
jgi:hypothetical protein